MLIGTDFSSRGLGGDLRYLVPRHPAEDGFSPREELLTTNADGQKVLKSGISIRKHFESRVCRFVSRRLRSVFESK